MMTKGKNALRGCHGAAGLVVCFVLALVVLSGCVGVTGDAEDYGEDYGQGETAVSGLSSQTVLARAEGIAPHNRPYVFNGVQDCYGYVRQVWNAILYDGSMHSEDFHPNSYDKSRWLGVSGGLPVADYPSSNWVYFSDPNVLLPGDVLSTHQGHAWGDTWHGGLYAGVSNGQHRIWDNSGSANGAYNRPFYWGFHYYYRPTHDMLAGGSSTSGSSGSASGGSSPGTGWVQEYGTFTPYFPINVRSGPSTSSSVVATYDAGESVNYDSYYHDGWYVWIHYVSYGGYHRYLVCRENGTAWGDFSSASAPASSAESGSSGDDSENSGSASSGWVTEYGTFVPYFAINVRSGPSTSSSVVATYEAGDSVHYDSYHDDGHYVWLHYVSYSGHDRYLVARENGTAWGDFY
jgi:uncharacterized protein YgiM (DUF1202 family)